MRTSELHDFIASHSALRANVRRGIDAPNFESCDRLGGLGTGFTVIDHSLPWQGWPVGAMTEIMTEGTGRGELSLLLPAMARCSVAKRQIVCIGAPHPIFAASLEQAGIDTTRVTQVHASASERRAARGPTARGPTLRGPLDVLWSAEQTLKSGTAGMVMVWTHQCAPDALRRLNLAVLNRDTVMIHFRDRESLTQASPAWVRLTLTADARSVYLHVIKCRGRLTASPVITLDRTQVQAKLYEQINANRLLDHITRFGVSTAAAPIATTVATTSTTLMSRSPSLIADH